MKRRKYQTTQTTTRREGKSKYNKPQPFSFVLCCYQFVLQTKKRKPRAPFLPSSKRMEFHSNFTTRNRNLAVFTTGIAGNWCRSFSLGVRIPLMILYPSLSSLVPLSYSGRGGTGWSAMMRRGGRYMHVCELLCEVNTQDRSTLLLLKKGEPITKG